MFGKEFRHYKQSSYKVTTYYLTKGSAQARFTVYEGSDTVKILWLGFKYKRSWETLHERSDARLIWKGLSVMGFTRESKQLELWGEA